MDSGKGAPPTNQPPSQMETYMLRMNNILTQLQATRKKTVAIQRLDVLKEQVAIWKAANTKQ
jgi:hypothetical protein